MTFNLQGYHLVHRAIKEQKPHQKYSLAPKKLLLVLKRIHGDSGKQQKPPVVSPGEKLCSPGGWMVLAELREPKSDRITSEHGTVEGNKTTPGTAGSPWERRCHGGEGATGTHKIRNVSPASFRHWELSSYLGYRELKTVNTTLHGFLARPCSHRFYEGY